MLQLLGAPLCPARRGSRLCSLRPAVLSGTGVCASRGAGELPAMRPGGRPMATTVLGTYDKMGGTL